MDEAQHLADRVVVLASGRVHRRRGSPTTLGRDGGRRRRSASPARRCRCRPARASSAASRASPARTPTRDLAPLLAWAAAARHGARGPDRDPPQPRGRLPGADRGGRMTLRPCSPRWIFARMRLTLRNPRAVVFTLRVPADPVVLFSALNGNAEVETLRPDDPLRPVLHAGDRGLQPRHRLLHDDRHGPGRRPRPGPAQARARHAAADGDLPRRVGDRRGGRSASAPSLLLFAVAVPAFGVHVYARHAARGDRHAAARRGAAWRRSASRSRAS